MEDVENTLRFIRELEEKQNKEGQINPVEEHKEDIPVHGMTDFAELPLQPEFRVKLLSLFEDLQKGKCIYPAINKENEAKAFPKIRYYSSENIYDDVYLIS